MKENSTALRALTYVMSVIDNSEAWWMDCPGRGGFDREIIEAGIKELLDAGYEQD